MPGSSPDTTRSPLQPIWQRAAVLGSLWAASEIVLGSFLHNLRIPFSGHALTAIAVGILVAGHRAWPVPGLLVRAGLIAALMKAVSPSAVLLGPMVAIAMEGVLMEAGVRLLGGRLAGYVLGGALAMSWTLGHKIASLLLTYGWDLVRLYQDLIVLAERQVGSVPLGPWGPLLVLAGLNLALGGAVAAAGSRITPREVGEGRSSRAEGALAEWRGRLGGVPGGGVRPSLAFLALWLTALPLGLLGFGRLPLTGKVLVAALVVLGAASRYRRALRRLGRPGFWIALVAVTLLAGLVMGILSPSGDVGWLRGLGMGVGMSLHAVFVTMCFAALSTELSHPLLRRWLEGVGGGQLHGAVHAAFATLPLVVAALPPPRELLRGPGGALGGLLPRMEEWLQVLREPYRVAGVITGDRREGKTTCAGAVIEALRGEGFRVGGILAPGEIRDGRRWSIDLLDLGTGRRLPMATRDPESPWPTVGAFRVNPEALELGRQALLPQVALEQDLLVVDEVGPWELAGEGWSSALEVLQGREVPLLLVVRRGLLSDVLARFAPQGAPVWDVAITGAEDIAEAVGAALHGAGNDPGKASAARG